MKEIKNNQILRKTGIDIVGDVPWGTHFCQFYKTKKDLLDILIPYFKRGLESNEKCVWVTSEFLNTKEALAALRVVVPNLSKYVKKGQMEIFPHTEWYLKGGVFEMKRVLGDWVRMHNIALSDGFDGMRVSGNPFWIENKQDWIDFAEYESEINSVIEQYKLLVLCTYSLTKCTSDEVIDVVSNHEFALIKRVGKWETIESIGHKKIEEALRKSEQRYRSFIEVTGQLGWTTNAEGEVVEDIPSWRNYTGQSFDEIKGWGWAKALHPEDYERTKSMWEKAVKDKIKYEIEYRILRHDGVYRYFLVRGIPIFKPDGAVQEWVGTCSDITRLKELDMQKDEFISIASHELKTPLTSIKIHGQIIEKYFKKEKLKKFIELSKRMNNQIDILHEYVTDLFDVNKIQVGKLVLKRGKFDIYDLMKEEVLHLKEVFPQNLLKLYCIHQKITADKERIRQVLINLITNAVKYSPNSKNIFIRCKKRKNELIVSVQDFGVGIPKDQHEKIFNKFFQVEKFDGKQNSGLGLGLFICKDIIERHGGKIWVESLPSVKTSKDKKKVRGSIFYFSLPLGKKLIKVNSDKLSELN